MKYLVRPMLMKDIVQVSEIEREVFPTQWPPTAFKRELQNKLAHYMVAIGRNDIFPETDVANNPRISNPIQPKQAEQGWLSRLKYFFKRERPDNADTQQDYGEHIVGAVGFWLIVDEAHITTIGVRQSYQRLGIGELLLFKSIELAREMGARVITLEVRVANKGAQALYEKYGFQRMGLRRGYYSDNKEDALIMTTDDINSTTYQSRFQLLKEKNDRKWN